MFQTLDDRVSVQPIRSGDIKEYCGAQTRFPSIGYVFFYNGEYAGITGIELRSPAYVLFSDISADLKIPKQTIWRCANIVVKDFAQRYKPLVAFSDINSRSSRKFCERLGFIEYYRDKDVVYYYLP
ncbi:MAG: hypothetical protein CUN56_00520 [Phototrophicales bacterium]|nr:MAG: hypothetical protein CUN56_00520 [Phototrophicales bacterium]